MGYEYVNEPELADGTYRFVIEDIKDGVIYGNYMKGSRKKVLVNINIRTLEEKLIKSIEKDLRNKLAVKGDLSFNLVVEENGSEYKLIEVPQPGIIMGGIRPK